MNAQQDDYAPPPGPLPGWQPNHQHLQNNPQHHFNYQYHQASPQSYPASNHGQFGYHPPSQGPPFDPPDQGHHNPIYPQHPGNPQNVTPQPPPTASPHNLPSQTLIRFPQKLYVWYSFSGNEGETYLEMGEVAKKDPVLFSSKLHMSGKMIFQRDKFRPESPSIGTIKDQSMMGSSSEVTLENGSTATWKPGGLVGEKRFTFDVPNNGRAESWVWEVNKQGLGQKLSGKNKGCKLFRSNSNGLIAATFTYEDDYYGSSKSNIGFFEFDPAVMTGQMGSTFQLFAVMAF